MKPQVQPTQKRKRSQTFWTRYVKTEREEEDSNLGDPKGFPLYMIRSNVVRNGAGYRGSLISEDNFNTKSISQQLN